MQLTPSQGFFIGRWPLDQNSSHVETRNDLARSMVVHVQSYLKKERKAGIGNRKTHITSCTSDERQSCYSLLTNLKKLTPLLKTPEKKLEIPVEPAMPGVVKSKQLDRQGTDAKSCSVKKKSAATLCVERRATFSNEKGKANRSVRISEVYSSCKTRSFA